MKKHVQMRWLYLNVSYRKLEWEHVVKLRNIWLFITSLILIITQPCYTSKQWPRSSMVWSYSWLMRWLGLLSFIPWLFWGAMFAFPFVCFAWRTLELMSLIKRGWWSWWIYKCISFSWQYPMTIQVINIFVTWKKFCCNLFQRNAVKFAIEFLQTINPHFTLKLIWRTELWWKHCHENFNFHHMWCKCHVNLNFHHMWWKFCHVKMKYMHLWLNCKK